MFFSRKRTLRIFLGCGYSRCEPKTSKQLDTRVCRLYEYTHRSPELYYSLQGRFERIYVRCNTIVSNVCATATAIFHRLPVESSNFGDIIRVSRCKTCDPNIVGTHPSVDPMVNGLRSGSNRQYWSVCPSTHRYINRAVVAATHARGSSTIGIEKQK